MLAKKFQGGDCLACHSRTSCMCLKHVSLDNIKKNLNSLCFKKWLAKQTRNVL